jgi:hypothetical protein
VWACSNAGVHISSKTILFFGLVFSEINLLTFAILKDVKYKLKFNDLLHWVSHGVVMGLISSSAFALVHDEYFCQEYLPL